MTNSPSATTRRSAASHPSTPTNCSDARRRNSLGVRALRELASAEKDKPAVTYDPVTVRATDALRELSRLCLDIDYFLNSEHGDRFRKKLEAHRVGPATIADLRAALSEFAAEAATGALDDDRASDEDLAAGRFGRRV